MDVVTPLLSLCISKNIFSTGLEKTSFMLKHVFSLLQQAPPSPCLFWSFPITLYSIIEISESFTELSSLVSVIPITAALVTFMIVPIHQFC